MCPFNRPLHALEPPNGVTRVGPWQIWARDWTRTGLFDKMAETIFWNFWEKIFSWHCDTWRQMASQVISEKSAEFFWWMRSVQSCGEVLRRYLIKRRGAALPLLIEKIDSRRRAESIVTAGPEGCGRSGRSWCAWISLWSCLIETDGFQSRTHEPIYRYLRQSDGRSSNKLTLKMNVCPDHVGLKRCFIDHFKGYLNIKFH